MKCLKKSAAIVSIILVLGIFIYNTTVESVNINERIDKIIKVVKYNKAINEMDQPLNAVIDRFEGETAIVLVGEKEQQLDVLKGHLPEGATEGNFMVINFELSEKQQQFKERKLEIFLEKIKNNMICK